MRGKKGYRAEFIGAYIMSSRTGKKTWSIHTLQKVFVLLRFIQYVHAVCIEADFTDLRWLLTLLVDGTTSALDGMEDR
jgi:hypothetical protein